MKTAEELLGDGLVAKLQLEPGKHYVILIAKSALSANGFELLSKYLASLDIPVGILAVRGSPRDSFVGLEITEAP